MARILIADDDASVRSAIRRALVNAGHTVEEANDGIGVLASYDRAPHDVVLMDLYMPGMDGLQAIIRLKAEHPNARVIAVSGGGFREANDVLGMARERGASATLAKPFELEQLLRTVADVLRQEPPPPRGKPKATVLLVEDDKLTRSVLRRRMEEGGYQVIESPDAPGALAQDAAWDLMVADLILPGASGTELIKRVRSQSPGAGVVAISGDPDRLQEFEQEFSGEAGIVTLPKPFTTTQLLEALEAVLPQDKARKPEPRGFWAGLRSLFSRAPGR